MQNTESYLFQTVIGFDLKVQISPMICIKIVFQYEKQSAFWDIKDPPVEDKQSRTCDLELKCVDLLDR